MQTRPGPTHLARSISLFANTTIPGGGYEATGAHLGVIYPPSPEYDWLGVFTRAILGLEWFLSQIKGI
jgi:hypothetical protein